MIEIFCGPMFAGKTTALFEIWKRNGNKTKCFKPLIDTRAAENVTVSHDNFEIPCEAVATAGDILSKVSWNGGKFEKILIDEAQFFGSALVPVAIALSKQGMTVSIACLDLDSNGLPFGSVGDLLAVADDVHKLKGVCSVCGRPATRTFRKATPSNERTLIGGSEYYEPMCMRCFCLTDKMPF